MKKYTIGVLIGNAEAEHIKNLMRGMNKAAESLNINIIFYLSYHMTYYNDVFTNDKVDADYDYQASVIFDYALMGDVDALIFTFGSLTIFLEDKDFGRFVDKFEGIPYVVVEDRDIRKKGSSVQTDNYKGMRVLVEHLVNVHDYKRFAFLGGPKGNRDAAERLMAFRDVMDEHGIEFAEDMYAEGDFTANVEHHIVRLLDNYPDTQCIVCANDTMAEAVYRVAAKRGLKVGRDLAVTGYDDEYGADAMNPPLTTVLQNDYDTAYIALIQALEMLEGGTISECTTPAVVRFRASCGCNSLFDDEKVRHEIDSSLTYKGRLDLIVKTISDKVIVSSRDVKTREAIEGELASVASEQYELFYSGDIEHYDKSNLTRVVNELLCGKYCGQVSPMALMDAIRSLYSYMMIGQHDSNKLRILNEIMALNQDVVQSIMIRKNKNGINHVKESTMMIPLISRDMMNHMNNEVEFFKAPMKILARYGAASSYLLVTDKPIKNKINRPWELPKKMYLAAYHDANRTYAYRSADRPVIKAGEGLLRSMQIEDGHHYSAYCLFLGDKQYGLLLTEIELEDQIIMYEAATQISVALEFWDICVKNRQMKAKLEDLVEEVSEKNKILGFISSTDQLSGIYNRRGFFEQCMIKSRQNPGRYGVLMLGDLDHLKQINDYFGHYEGDFAITACVEILSDALGEDAVVGRIGGDEFAALIVSDKKIDGDAVLARIKNAYTTFNEESGKNFYVELSLGYRQFVLSTESDFDEIMKMADVMMYENKNSRRKSVRRK